MRCCEVGWWLASIQWFAEVENCSIVDSQLTCISFTHSRDIYRLAANEQFFLKGNHLQRMNKAICTTPLLIQRSAYGVIIYSSAIVETKLIKTNKYIDTNIIDSFKSRTMSLHVLILTVNRNCPFIPIDITYVQADAAYIEVTYTIFCGQMYYTVVSFLWTASWGGRLFGYPAKTCA